MRCQQRGFLVRPVVLFAHSNLPGRQSAAQVQPSLARGASGLHISDWGGDTPTSDRSNEIAAKQQADASYPAGSAEDEIAASSFALQRFVQRGYQHDRSVSPSQFDYPSLRQDANGLCWTAEDKLTVPSFDKLREEVFESIHVHPFSGHWV